MPVLPPSVPIATVTGWFTQAVADSDDEDRDPDMVAMSGSVIFTPNVLRAKVIAAGYSPLTIFPKPIVCSLDADGHLLGPDGELDVKLIATGDLIPSYKVTFVLDGVDKFTMNIALPVGDPVDLALVVDIPAVPSAELAAWTAAVAAATTARDAAIAAAGGMVDGPSDWSGDVHLAQSATHGQYLRRTLIADTVVSLDDGITGQAYRTLVEVSQDATGGRALELHGVRAAGGTGFAVTADADAVDVIELVWNGTDWTARVIAADTSVPAAWA